MKATKRYYRIAGFFSSTALTVAAEGIEGLCQNHGHMYLLVSPQLSRKDFEIIQKHQPLDEHADLFQELKLDEAADDHLKLLAYLLDQGFLESRSSYATIHRPAFFIRKSALWSMRGET